MRETNPLRGPILPLLEHQKWLWMGIELQLEYVELAMSQNDAAQAHIELAVLQRYINDFRATMPKIEWAAEDAGLFNT